MDSKEGHITVATLVFLGIVWGLPERLFSEIRLAYLYLIVLATMLPDLDLWFGWNHRNGFFHSILIPALSLLAVVDAVTICGLLSIGIHLLLDIKLHRKGGTYCVKFLKWRLGYKGTTLWLFINGIIGVGIFIWFTVVN